MALGLAHGARIPDDLLEVAEHTLDAAGPDGVAEPDRVMTVSVVVEAHRLSQLIGALGPAVVCVGEEQTTIRRINTYRGRTCDSELAAIRLGLEVRSADLDEVLSTTSSLAAEAPEVALRQRGQRPATASAVRSRRRRRCCRAARA